MEYIEMRPQCLPFKQKQVIQNTQYPIEFIQKKKELIAKHFDLENSTPDDIVVRYCRSSKSIPNCALYRVKITNIYGYMYYIARVYDLWNRDRKSVV